MLVGGCHTTPIILNFSKGKGKLRRNFCFEAAWTKGESSKDVVRQA